MNQCECRDTPCKKSWKQGNPLSNTIKDTGTIMHNPLLELCREGYAFALVPHIFHVSHNKPSYAHA